MKVMPVLAFALFLALPAAPGAQAAPDAVAPAPLSIASPIEKIVADPAGKAVIEKLMPTLLGHAMYDSFKSMSLKELQPYSQGAITDEKLAQVEAALQAIRK
jgi:hypothetical protein